MEFPKYNSDDQFMIDSIIALLENLGVTAEEVAKHLEEDGIKGNAHSPINCPISLVVKQSLDHRITATQKFINIHLPDKHWASVETPSAIADFIKRFDKGEFASVRVGNVRRR